MLKPKQIKYIELLIKDNMTDKEIAQVINITPKTICYWKKNDQEFQQEYRKALHNAMQFAAAKAFKKEMALLDSKSDMVAHLAAKELLDRGGFSKKSGIVYDEEPSADDGFIQALKTEAAEVWQKE